MITEIKETWRYRAVIENFVRTSLGVRYRRSFLGYIWSVLSPVLKYAIMGVVFEIIGRFQMTNYYGFMFIGSLFFGYFSTVISQSTIAFIHNEHFIKKIYVPKLVFILNIVLYETFNFVLVLFSILFVLMLFGQVVISITWLFLPVALLFAILALTGLACIMAVATIYFRDLQHLTDIVFQALFFATPIFYPLSALGKSPELMTLALFNPILYFVTMVRDPLVFGRLPGIDVLGISATFAIVIFCLGLFTVKKFNNRIIFKL